MNSRRYPPLLAAVAALGITTALATPSGAATAADRTPPTVVSTTPRSGAVDQGTSTAPTATFSEAVQSSSIVYTFTDGTTPVPSKMSYNSSTLTATITPTSRLAYATRYTLTIKAKDVAGNQMTGAAPSWSFSTDAPPAAQLAAAPAGGDVPLAVAFDATASTDADSTPIASYAFTWGDGTAGSGTQTSGKATHTYTKAGTYTATVTVTDTAGYSATASTSVVASNPDYPPAASLAASPATPTAGDTVTLDASGSTDTDDTGIASYTFDFGDGSAVTGPQPGATATHVYAAGSYPVKVTVTDTAGKSSTATTTVVVSAPVVVDNPPSAGLTSTPDGALAPADVTLDASGSTDDNGIAGYTFDFGDGSAVTGPQPGATAVHTYTKAGVYAATVTVTDTAGKTATATTTVTVVKDDAPAAALAATPTSGMVPLAVSLDAGASTDTDATGIATYTFDYGDGTPAVKQASATASHTYTSDGTYLAKVTVTDSAGNATSATSTITVTPDNAPSVVLAGPSTATTNAEVTFSGSSSTDTDGTPIASYAFGWGDGTPGTGELVDSTASHTYAKAGTYQVTLTVKDTGGQTATATRNVTVSDPPPVVVDNPPTAKLAVAVSAGQPLAVTADATASTDGDSTPIDTYAFDFGDGTVLQAQAAGTAQHTYAKGGTYTVTVTVTDTASKAATATATVTVTAPAPPPPPPALKNTTVVLTFDDGTVGQDQAAAVLKQYGMRGTFYVNSGRLGFPGYLTPGQVQAIAADGNEVGGHTVNHSDLTTLSADDAAREICNDRVALANLGLRPTSFAYPFGAFTSTTETQVKNCGYTNARKIADLKSNPYGCFNCPTANPIPVPDAYAIKTNSSVKYDTTLSILQTYVTQAENDQGGLVPIVFHHVGSTGDTNEISLATFTQFVQWLAQRPGTTVVKTMDQVVGGSYVTPVPGPALPVQKPNLVQNYSLEQATNNVPTGFQLGSSGANTATWAWSTDAHSGSRSERVDITSYTSGDRKLVMKQDSSSVPPQVVAGHKYTASVWAKGSGSGAIVTYYRDSGGVWRFWQQAPTVAYGSAWTQYTFTTPAVPAGATAVSFGLSLFTVGNLTTDDYSLLDNG